MSATLPVNIAVQLLECRDAHKRIFGETFDSVAKDYQDLLQEVAKKKKAGLLETALAMAEQMKAAGQERAVPLFIAAAVDLIDTPRTPA